MRHLKLLLFALLIVHVSYAQEENQLTRNFYPVAKDVGVTANLSGLIQNIALNPNRDLLSTNSFVLRYTQSEKITWRLGLAPMVYNNKVLRTDSVGKDLVEFDSTTTRSSMSFRPGLEYHFKGTERLDPYFVLEGEFGIIGKTKIAGITNTSDTTGTSQIIQTITEDGGFTTGAKLSLGMNYFVAKKLFVGMEYGVGFSSIITGGDRQEVIQLRPVSGTDVTISNPSSFRSRDTRLNVDPMVQITIGYFFSL